MAELPQLYTGGVDVSNALLQMANQRRADAQLAKENETRGYQNELLRGRIANLPAEESAQNALAAYRLNKQKLESAKAIHDQYGKSMAYILSAPKNIQGMAFKDFAKTANDNGLYVDPNQFDDPKTGEFNSDAAYKWTQDTLNKLNEFTGEDNDSYQLVKIFDKKGNFVGMESVNTRKGYKPPVGSGYTTQEPKDNSMTPYQAASLGLQAEGVNARKATNALTAKKQKQEEQIPDLVEMYDEVSKTTKLYNKKSAKDRQTLAGFGTKYKGRRVRGTGKTEDYNGNPFADKKNKPSTGGKATRQPGETIEQFLARTKG